MKRKAKSRGFASRQVKRKRSRPPVVTAPRPNIVVRHPPGTMHRLPRKWLEENGELACKDDAPEEVVALWAILSSTQLDVSVLGYAEFFKDHGKHMRFTTMFGSYDYRTTLKIIKDDS